MSQDPQNDAFEKRTRELLEESTARLEGRVLSRLTQARHGALGQLQNPRRPGWLQFLPASAAAAAVIAVVMWTTRPGEEVPVPVAQNGGALEDIEMLADADAPDFVDGEDLEFYAWAADEIES